MRGHDHDRLLEHPDISASGRSGYAAFQEEENRDSRENRMAYIEEHTSQLVNWLSLGYPEILEEFIRFSPQLCRESYEDWLN